jgi:hypothetical protein
MAELPSAETLAAMRARASVGFNRAWKQKRVDIAPADILVLLDAYEAVCAQRDTEHNAKVQAQTEAARLRAAMPGYNATENDLAQAVSLLGMAQVNARTVCDFLRRRDWPWRRRRRRRAIVARLGVWLCATAYRFPDTFRNKTGGTRGIEPARPTPGSAEPPG